MIKLFRKVFEFFFGGMFEKDEHSEKYRRPRIVSYYRVGIKANETDDEYLKTVERKFCGGCNICSRC